MVLHACRFPWNSLKMCFLPCMKSQALDQLGCNDLGHWQNSQVEPNCKYQFFIKWMVNSLIFMFYLANPKSDLL
jgi:hypothetical protein